MGQLAQSSYSQTEISSLLLLQAVAQCIFSTKGIQRILASEKMASTRVEAKRTKTQKWTQ
jgi:hypothetical protein